MVDIITGVSRHSTHKRNEAELIGLRGTFTGGSEVLDDGSRTGAFELDRPLADGTNRLFFYGVFIKTLSELHATYRYLRDTSRRPLVTIARFESNNVVHYGVAVCAANDAPHYRPLPETRKRAYSKGGKLVAYEYLLVAIQLYTQEGRYTGKPFSHGVENVIETLAIQDYYCGVSFKHHSLTLPLEYAIV